VNKWFCFYPAPCKAAFTAWRSPFSDVGHRVSHFHFDDTSSGPIGDVVIPCHRSAFLRPGEGLVFFSAVTEKSSANSYVRELEALSDAQVTEARIRHSYDISDVCS
jgi:hypothetical protein